MTKFKYRCYNLLTNVYMFIVGDISRTLKTMWYACSGCDKSRCRKWRKFHVGVKVENRGYIKGFNRCFDRSNKRKMPQDWNASLPSTNNIFNRLLLSEAFGRGGREYKEKKRKKKREWSKSRRWNIGHFSRIRKR